jgi:hypothetical protein
VVQVVAIQGRLLAIQNEFIFFKRLRIDWDRVQSMKQWSMRPS